LKQTPLFKGVTQLKELIQHISRLLAFLSGNFTANI